MALQNLVKCNQILFCQIEACCGCRIADGSERIKIQESELEDATWMPLTEAADLPIFKGGAFQVIMDACLGFHKGDIPGFKAEAIQNSFTKRSDLIIHPLQ